MKKITLASIIFLAILLILSTGAYFVRKNIDNPKNTNDPNLVTFEIVKGQGVEEIGDNLEKHNLINGSIFFKIYLWQNDAGSKLKAGTYQVSPSMTIAEMVELFTGGEAGIKSNEVRITLIEGSSNTEIFEQLRKSGAIAEGEDFNNIQIADLSKYKFLDSKPANADLQGYLFPDTYNFFKNSSIKDATVKILDNFDKKFTQEMRDKIDRQNKTVYDIIILASIVEKEAANKAEMPTIASVFYNRLAIGQPLQSDATVNYITKAGRAMPTNEDLEVDSPYNTYRYQGLPPTPICNPSIEAISAAIYPSDTDYFYFLTTQDEQHKTYFSETYEEHLQNKAVYLK